MVYGTAPRRVGYGTWRYVTGSAGVDHQWSSHQPSGTRIQPPTPYRYCSLPIYVRAATNKNKSKTKQPNRYEYLGPPTSQLHLLPRLGLVRRLHFHHFRRWIPSHARTAGNEKADEWAKMAARNERGSEQRRRKAVASRFYQLRTGHSLIRPARRCTWPRGEGMRRWRGCWWEREPMPRPPTGKGGCRCTLPRWEGTRRWRGCWWKQEPTPRPPTGKGGRRCTWPLLEYGVRKAEADGLVEADWLKMTVVESPLGC